MSYPRYCRYRSALRRMTHQTAVVDALSTRLLAAVGLTADLPLPTTSSTVRVLFCRATVVHPALQKHAFRLDELGTKLSLNVNCLDGNRMNLVDIMFSLCVSVCLSVRVSVCTVGHVKLKEILHQQGSSHTQLIIRKGGVARVT